MVSVLRPDRPLLFHSMKSKQKSCQNEPSAGRFDGPRTRFERYYHKFRKMTFESVYFTIVHITEIVIFLCELYVYVEILKEDLVINGCQFLQSCKWNVRWWAKSLCNIQ